jgi:hypothetical protein
VDTSGADVLIRFVRGARVVTKMEGRAEWTEPR